MKAKVSALSMEAKASAVILGALPFIVAFQSIFQILIILYHYLKRHQAT